MKVSWFTRRCERLILLHETSESRTRRALLSLRIIGDCSDHTNCHGALSGSKWSSTVRTCRLGQQTWSTAHSLLKSCTAASYRLIPLRVVRWARLHSTLWPANTRRHEVIQRICPTRIFRPVVSAACLVSTIDLKTYFSMIFVTPRCKAAASYIHEQTMHACTSSKVGKPPGRTIAVSKSASHQPQS